MGRPNKKRSAAHQREIRKKIKRKIVDPLAWSFEDPWRISIRDPSVRTTELLDARSLSDISQPDLVLQPEDSPSPISVVECGSICEIPMAPELEASIVLPPWSLPDLNVLVSSVSIPDLDQVLETPPVFVDKREKSDPILPEEPSVQYDEAPVSYDPPTQSASAQANHDTVTYHTVKRTITLSRSSTTILEIPGVPAGRIFDVTQDCYCSACMKWASADSRTEKLQDDLEVTTNEETAEAGEMKRIYETLRHTKASCRFINKNNCIIGSGNSGLRKTSKHVSAKRYQAIDADVYSKVEIPHEKHIHGRRIVDYEYFIKWITLAQATHSQICLGVLTPYQENFKSMVSSIYLQCNVCGEIVKGSSEQPSAMKRLRRSIGWAILCSGTTYTQAHEMFSFLNVPFLTRNAFMIDETALDSVLEDALKDSLSKAIQGEKFAVIEELRQKGITPEDKENVQSCAALDGSWGQRSNGHRYNSASGCAAVIATRTKKVCYVGCKNKRCVACTVNVKRAKNNQPIRNHKCYRNYKGASGGMEPAIIIEGFEVLRKQGLKFTTVVTDGDSTTVAHLKNRCRYGPEIRHQLCCNHIMKNMGKKLREIKIPKQYAVAVRKSFDRTTRGIRAAIKYCAEKTSGSDIEGLRYDIRNAPYHAFGSHSNCRDYFCTIKEENEDCKLISDLEHAGIWNKILVIVEKIAAKAEFISENETSNLVENLYCRLSKYNVGKRVDTMSRGSYQRRVFITVLQHNDGYSWQEKYMHLFTGEDPGFFMRKMVEGNKRSALRTKIARNKPTYSRKNATLGNEEELDYGEEAVAAAEDLANDHYDFCTVESKYELSEKTRKQLSTNISISAIEEIAMGRILTKFVPEVINCRESNKWKKCDMILQATNTWNYLKSNRAIVGLVLRCLHGQLGSRIGENQMFVDTCHAYLCCVVDAISEDGNTVLLIKKGDSKDSVSNTIMKPSNKFGCRMKNGNLSICKSLKIEVQSLLHTCKVSKCLICFVNSNDYTDNVQITVEYDDDFFQKQVSKKLADFFEQFLSKRVFENAVSIKT